MSIPLAPTVTVLSNKNIVKTAVGSSFLYKLKKSIKINNSSNPILSLGAGDTFDGCGHTIKFLYPTIGFLSCTGTETANVNIKNLKVTAPSVNDFDYDTNPSGGAIVCGQSKYFNVMLE